MTYYEWVNYIEGLTNKSITDEDIKKINESTFDYSVDIMVRITDHYINVILKKLNEAEDNLINNLDKIKSPHELTLQINDIKETLKDVNKLLTIKLFDEELLNYLKENIFNYSNGYIDIIKKHYKGNTSSEYAIILNNLKFMEVK